MSSQFQQPGKTSFPDFGDGDVVIVIRGDSVCRLHSKVLANSSAWFRCYLTEQNAAKLDRSCIKKGNNVRWRFHLRSYEATEDNPVLIPVALNELGQPINKDAVVSRFGFGMPDPIGDAYMSVLGAMYGVPIHLGEFQIDSLRNMLETAYSINSIATLLDCIAVITKPIEADLLSHGQNFFRSISHSPMSWLTFAQSIRSRLIFRESLIHAVGQHNKIGTIAIREQCPENIATLIEKKYNILKDRLKWAQMHIMTYMPAQLQRDAAIGLLDRDAIGRNSYQNDIFGWMGLTAFRHWMIQNLIHDQTHEAQDLGFEFMQLVAEGGNAYLGHGDLEVFYRQCPMTGKGQQVLEVFIGEMKAFCRQFAAEFMENNSQLDLKRYPTGCFTCVDVSPEDYEVANL